MAIHAHSTTAPARPLLPLVPFVFRPAAPVDDPRDPAELLEEIRRIVKAGPDAEPQPELGPAESAASISRRKELYEILHPETAHGTPSVSRQIGDTGKRAEIDRFTADTASRTGRSERAVQRDAARGEALGADLGRVAGTYLDKGLDLDAPVFATVEKTPEPALPANAEDPATRVKALELFDRAGRRGPGGPNNSAGLGGRSGKIVDPQIVTVDNIHGDKKSDGTRPTGTSAAASLRRLEKEATKDTEDAPKAQRQLDEVRAGRIVDIATPLACHADTPVCPAVGQTSELPPEPSLSADVRQGGAGVLSSEQTQGGVLRFGDTLDAARAIHLRRQLVAAAEHGAALLASLSLQRLVGTDTIVDPVAAGEALDLAIATLDALDGDAELEDEGEAEVSLGWTAHVCQSALVGHNTENELDTADGEPSLASPERHPEPSHCSAPWSYVDRGPGSSQLRWADGARHDGEAVNEDGDDLDIGEHDTADAEPSLGRPEDFLAREADALNDDVMGEAEEEADTFGRPWWDRPAQNAADGGAHV